MTNSPEIQTCHKVAAYLRSRVMPYLADIFADKDEAIEAKRNVKSSFFIEFYLVFYPLEVERVNQKLEFAIRQYSKGAMDGDKLKSIVDEWVKAHTVAWQDGVPYWKSKEVNGCLAKQN